MNKTTLIAFTLLAAGGFALGWLSSQAPSPANARPAANDAPRADVAASAQPGGDSIKVSSERRYALRPEDVAADRETPAIAVDAKGRVVVAWASQTEELERTLFLLRSNDSGATFEPPVPFRKVPIYKFQSKTPGKTMSFSTHVLPRLTADADTIWLGWVEALKGGPTVQYMVARSTDGGRTFSDPIPAHGETAKRPGFTSLSLGADGTLLTSWLDGRNQVQQPFLALMPKGTESNRFEKDLLVYAGPEEKGICPCCDLSVARTSNGQTYVGFRDNDSGHRDICIARSSSERPGTFEPPVPVTSQHWKFDGCPHDGPSLALAGDQLHLLWMDAHTGKNRVYAASSTLDSAALAFTPRTLPAFSAESTQGHPKLIADASQALHAVWDESLEPAPTSSNVGAASPSAPPAKAAGESHGHGTTPSSADGGRAIVYTKASPNGEFQKSRAVAARPGVFQLNPSLAVSPSGQVFICWNELDTEGKQVVVVQLAPEK